jgi:hypothetical protein
VPAGAREADAEIGVLGDVVGVPAADRVEHGARKMVGGPAQRDGQIETLERRQEAVEQRRVFDGELARERYYGANATTDNPECNRPCCTLR